MVDLALSRWWNIVFDMEQRFPWIRKISRRKLRSSASEDFVAAKASARGDESIEEDDKRERSSVAKSGEIFN